MAIETIENLENCNLVEYYKDILQSAFCKYNISAKQAIVSIGNHHIFFRQVSFPFMDKQELADTVKWEHNQYVPFEEGTYYFDFAILKEDKINNEIKLMLVAGKKEYIDFLTNVFSELSINLLAIEGEVFSLARVIEDDKNCILIDIGKEASQIIIYQDRVPIIVRNISIGGDYFDQMIAEVCDIDKIEAEYLKKNLGKKNFLENDFNTEEVMLRIDKETHKIITEVIRTIEYYKMQNRNVSIDKIFLCGGGAKLIALTKNIMSHIEIPVMLLKPEEKIYYDSCFDTNYIKDISLQFATTIGLILRGEK